jgi:hypothetical protein
MSELSPIESHGINASVANQLWSTDERTALSTGLSYRDKSLRDLSYAEVRDSKYAYYFY